MDLRPVRQPRMTRRPMVYDVAQESPEGQDPACTGRSRKAHAMRTPRQLLVAVAIALLVIAWHTFRFPPDYLAFSAVWSAVSAIAGFSCAAAAIYPRRLWIAASGAFVVCATAARSIANLFEIPDRVASAQAGYVVASAAWALIAILSFVVWREYVLPWSITREARYRR